MYDAAQLRKDCETLEIENIENITTRYVTARYRKLAKQRHPDRDGGTNEDFQEEYRSWQRK